MRFMGKFALIMMAGLLLVACGSEASTDKLQKFPAPEALAMQKKLSTPGPLDMARVHTLRLRINGERRDVVSLQPEVINKVGTGDQESATVFAFSADRKSVEMFTRDPKSGIGYMDKIASENFKPKYEFRFPLVSEKGIKDAKIEVVDYTVLP